jgi:hypothetical protein
MVLLYVEQLAQDIKRLNHISPMTSLDEAQIIDRYTGQITAYLNGRIQQIISINNGGGS